MPLQGQLDITKYRELNKFKLSAKGYMSELTPVFNKLGVSMVEEYRFPMLGDFDFNFAQANQASMLDLSLDALSKAASLVGKTGVLDIPSKYRFTGMQEFTWSVNTFLSVYANYRSDIKLSVLDNYVKPLAFLSALLLPRRKDQNANLTNFINEIKGEVNKFMPNLSNLDFIQTMWDAVTNVAGKVDDVATAAAEKGSKGTILEGLYKDAFFLEMPVQLSQKVQTAGMGNGIVFTYGPWILTNCVIDSCRVSTGKLMYPLDLAKTEPVGIPEYIKLNITFRAAYKPTIDYMVKSFTRMSGN